MSPSLYSTSKLPNGTLKGASGSFKVPFGNFDVLYNDGDIRVVRTIQGYYGVNRRITAEEEMWG